VKLQPEEVEKPLRRLRKQLSRFPPNPRPEEVHLLRTSTRRLEATVAALVIDREKPSRRLVKAIRPVRKAAGKVRDMDVLIGEAMTLPDHQVSEAAIRLVEHLAKMRVKNARKLRGVIRARGEDARRLLKQSSKLIRRKLKDDSGALDGEAAPQILKTELKHWPELDAGNLHLFRIRIKELRYMLQLGQEADEKLVAALGEVKDSIGEWHDWVELLKIARKVLDPRSDYGVLKHIEDAGKQKFEHSLTIANRERERYFSGADPRKSDKRILQMVS
jgi:CHAD domain-containing protein